MQPEEGLSLKGPRGFGDGVVGTTSGAAGILDVVPIRKNIKSSRSAIFRAVWHWAL